MEGRVIIALSLHRSDLRQEVGVFFVFVFHFTDLEIFSVKMFIPQLKYFSSL